MISSDDKPYDLPLKSSALVYRRVDNEYEFLCLKRTLGDGEQSSREEGWWEFPGGGVRSNENIKQAMLRELEEETGITNPLVIIENIRHISWEWKGEAYISFIFAVEVADDTIIKLSPLEHTAFRWCTLIEAFSQLTYKTVKETLRIFQENYMHK